MNLTRLLFVVATIALWSPINAGNSDQWIPFTFEVLPGTCAVAPEGLTGTGLLSFVTLDNGHGHTGFVAGARGTATDPNGGRWIFADHDAGSPSEEAPTFLIENFHLIGQGRLPNVSV